MNQQYQITITISLLIPQNGRLMELTLMTLKNAIFQFSHTDLTLKEKKTMIGTLELMP